MARDKATKVKVTDAPFRRQDFTGLPDAVGGGAGGAMTLLGMDGDDGEQGEMGLPGPIGPSGGPIGPVGPAGPAGAIGSMGIPGLDGYDGDQGEIGFQGPAGPPGVAGGAGVAGVDGQRGQPGLDGIDGEENWTPGPTGAAGPVGASGALVLLEQRTASASAQLDFTTALTALYDDYVIELVGCVPSADASLRLLVSSDGGATWAATNYRYGTQYVNQLGSVGSVFNGGGADWQVGLQSVESTAALAGLSATIRLRAPLNATYAKIGRLDGAQFANDGNQYAFHGALYYASAAAVNALRFKFDSSATFTAGTIRIYGVTTGAGLLPGASGCLAASSYSPAANTLFSTTSTAWADVDAANLLVSFTVPASGKVLVRLTAYADVSTNTQQYYWGLRSGTTNVNGSAGLATRSADGQTVSIACIISGLTPGAVVTYKWAHAVSGGASGRIGVGPGINAANSSTSAGMPPGIMEVFDAAPGSGGSSPAVACLVKKTAVQSLANNTTTKVTFDAETYDTDTMHDNVTNNTRITFTQGGRYAVSVSIEFAAHATGYRFVDVFLNNTSTLATDSRGAVTTDLSACTINFDYEFLAGDYIEVRAWQNSGGALDVAAKTRFSARRF